MRPGRLLALAIRARGGAAALLLAPILTPLLSAARPVAVVHPGGAVVADSTTLEFPVARSSVWYALWAGPDRAAPPPAPPPAAADSSRSASRLAGPAAGPSPSQADSARARTGARSGDALVLTGTKSLSVELGSNRDVGLKQALDLTVRGRVAGDVNVSASLSDRRLPFDPTGDTRQLDDLDRISVAITAPHAGATFGDFRLDGGRGEFARFSRQLEGVRGTASAGGAAWDVAAAGTKGERRSLEWRGEEGKQGPYALLAAGVGTTAEGLVAGSERVWLDGAEMKRGADADYVMDYDAATITFTTRRPVTAQSRIAADFEAVSGGYRRNIYSASSGGRVGAGEWYAGFTREGDDPHSPVGADLTADDRRALSSLGDSAQGASGRGVRYVGPGNGNYAWDVSDAANPHWLYLGADRADYLVEFTSVGQGRGAYQDTLSSDGVRFYRYMGKNLGTYTPGGDLPVPNSRQLVDVGGTVRLPGALALEAEVARSADDRNRLSPLDDGDNAGAAGRAALRLESRPVSLFGRGLGSLRGRASFRSVGDRFRSLDRLDGAFEGDRWNQGAAALGERRGEVALSYQPAGGLVLDGEVGLRALGGGSHAARRAAGAQLTGAVAGSFRFEEARNSGPGGAGGRTRTSAELGRDRGPLRPRVRFLEERIAGQEGDSARARRSREAGASLGWTAGPALTVRTGYTWREERREETPGPALAHGGTWEGAATIRRGAGFLLDLGLTRRSVSDAGRVTRNDLASLALLAGRAGSPVSSELRWDATQLREPKLERRFVPVGEGNGSYDANGNPRLGGGYDAVSALGAPETRSRATVQLRVDAYPGRAAGAPGGRPWRALGGSTLLRVETLSRLSLGSPRYALSPAAYLDPGTTIQGTLNARQSIDVAPRGAPFDVRLEGGVTRTLSNQYETLRLTDDGTDARIRLRAPLPGRARFTASVVVDRTVHLTERADGLPGDRSERRGHAADLELARVLTPAWGVSLLGHARRDHDRAHDAFQTTWSAGPAARCASGGRLRLDARALYASASQRGGYAPAGLYVQPVLGPRIAYNFLGEYRLREQVALTLSLDGEARLRTRDLYTGTFELRSYF